MKHHGRRDIDIVVLSLVSEMLEDRGMGVGILDIGYGIGIWDMKKRDREIWEYGTTGIRGVGYGNGDVELECRIGFGYSENWVVYGSWNDVGLSKSDRRIR